MIAFSTYAVFFVFGLLCIWAVWRTPDRPYLPIALGAHALSGSVIVLAATADGIVFDASTYLGDLWTAFDAIAKAAQGTRSSIDYFNPIGPVYEWGFLAALEFRPPSAAVLPLANAIVGAFVLVATVLMLSRRVSPLSVALVGLVAVTVAISPRELDALFVEAEASFLAPYNRWGWALFAPVIFLFAAPARTRDLLGPALAGVLIACMLLLKPTYGLAALGMAAVPAVLLPGRWRDAAIAAVALAVTVAVLEVLTGQVSAYLADLAETARMEQTGLRPLKLFNQVGEFALAMLFALLIFYAFHGEGSVVESIWRPVVLILAAGGAGWMVLMQNHYAVEAIVYLLLPVLAAEWAGLFRPAPEVTDPRLRASFLLVLLLVVLVRPLTDAGFVLAQNIQVIRQERDLRLAGGYMHDFVVHPRLLWGAPFCQGACSDHVRMMSGLELLKAAGADQPLAGRVLAINFSNPFPALLGKPSPAGVPIWTHIGRSISERQHPPAAEFFAEVDFLLQARDEPSSEAIAAIYADTIARDFEERAGDEHWRLFVRRN